MGPAGAAVPLPDNDRQIRPRPVRLRCRSAACSRGTSRVRFCRPGHDPQSGRVSDHSPPLGRCRAYRLIAVAASGASSIPRDFRYRFARPYPADQQPRRDGAHAVLAKPESRGSSHMLRASPASGCSPGGQWRNGIQMAGEWTSHNFCELGDRQQHLHRIPVHKHQPRIRGRWRGSHRERTGARGISPPSVRRVSDAADAAGSGDETEYAGSWPLASSHSR